jgi:hypothetical protein
MKNQIHKKHKNMKTFCKISDFQKVLEKSKKVFFDFLIKFIKNIKT